MHPDIFNSLDLFLVPRTRCLIFTSTGTADIGDVDLSHGETETRFVAAFAAFIKPVTISQPEDGQELSHLKVPQIEKTSGDRASQGRQCSAIQYENEIGHAEGGGGSECLILSDDTDVFIILLLSTILEGHGVIHVLKDAMNSIDQTRSVLRDSRLSELNAETAFVLAGCDFSPATYGIGHEVFIDSLSTFKDHCKHLGLTEEQHCDGYVNSAEKFLCLVFLLKQGYRRLSTHEEHRRHLQAKLGAVNTGEISLGQLNSFDREKFCSEYEVGTTAWTTDVRNHTVDTATQTNNLMPPSPHFRNHENRTSFIVKKYWGKSGPFQLTPAYVGGCSSEYGYKEDGSVLLESSNGVDSLQKKISRVTQVCQCQGGCSTKRCSCKKRDIKCIGCGCNKFICTKSMYKRVLENVSPLSLNTNAHGAIVKTLSGQGNVLSIDSEGSLESSEGGIWGSDDDERIMTESSSTDCSILDLVDSEHIDAFL